MPQISVRGIEMPESPIRKLAPLAVAAKKRGTKVYHLNIGQPDLPTPQVALDAIKNVDRKVLEYSPSQGYASYREKLVDYYAKYDIHVTADDIIITCGGSEAVLFAFMSCLNPGDEIIVPEPAYANYMAFAISAGAKIRTIATTIEEGFSLPKVEKLEELINDLPMEVRFTIVRWMNNDSGIFEAGKLPQVEVWAYTGSEAPVLNSYKSDKKFKSLVGNSNQFVQLGVSDKDGIADIQLNRKSLPAGLFFRPVGYDDKIKIQYFNLDELLNQSKGSYNKRRIRLKMYVSY